MSVVPVVFHSSGGVPASQLAFLLHALKNVKTCCMKPLKVANIFFDVVIVDVNSRGQTHA